jgi:hypothetical protein
LNRALRAWIREFIRGTAAANGIQMPARQVIRLGDAAANVELRATPARLKQR